MTYTKIVEHYGSLAAAAKELGFDKQRIFAWKRIRIPTEVQMEIAAKTGLKPDARAVREVKQWASTLLGVAQR